PVHTLHCAPLCAITVAVCLVVLPSAAYARSRPPALGRRDAPSLRGPPLGIGQATPGQTIGARGRTRHRDVDDTTRQAGRRRPDGAPGLAQDPPARGGRVERPAGVGGSGGST